MSSTASHSRKTTLGTGPAVVLTGISGNLGREVAKRLHRNYRVIGLDPRPVKHLPKDIEHYCTDFRRRRAEDVFRRNKPFALIHLGMIHRLRDSYDEAHSFNVEGLQRLFEFGQHYGVKKLIVMSSADVYGPLPGRDHFIHEGVNLQGDLHYPEMRMHVSMDRMTQSFLYMEPKIETTLLRPVRIVGHSLRNATTTYLRMPVFPYIIGYDPMLQAIHQNDLLAVIELVLKKSRVGGVYNISGTEAAPLRRVLKRLGKPLLPIPAPLARAAFEKLWRFNVLAFPPPELDHLQYSSVVDTTRMKEELGFVPQYGWNEIISEMREVIAAQG